MWARIRAALGGAVIATSGPGCGGARPSEVIVAVAEVEPARDVPAREPGYPSTAAYPGVSGRLRAALGAGDVRERLAALAESLAPYRWPGVHDWDRHGFIDLERPGFVTRVDGALVEQPAGRNDLGCAGGFLEGVRIGWLPTLAIAELDRCEPAGAVIGGPAGCDPERAYGWLALANIARRLSAAQLPAGPRLIELTPVSEAALDALAEPGKVHLCAVSHVSATRGRGRFYHHMLIALGAGGDIEVFDTTGARGVGFTVMSRARLVRYCTTLLAASETYRYLARSARLTCLEVSGSPPAGTAGPR